jgi:hypothetical protein
MAHNLLRLKDKLSPRCVGANNMTWFHTLADVRYRLSITSEDTDGTPNMY